VLPFTVEQRKAGEDFPPFGKIEFPGVLRDPHEMLGVEQARGVFIPGGKLSAGVLAHQVLPVETASLGFELDEVKGELFVEVVAGAGCDDTAGVPVEAGCHDGEPGKRGSLGAGQVSQLGFGQTPH